MEKKIVFTSCGICLSACGMEVELEDGRIVDVRGDKDHPLSKGFLCPKGKALAQYSSDEYRITSPYEKAGNAWRKITWEQAYAKIGQRLHEIVKRHGPRSVALYYGAGHPLSSMNVATAMGFLRALGSDRMYNVLTVEFTNRFYIMEKVYGRQYRTSQADYEHTDCLLLFGHNPLVSLDHPGIVDAITGLAKRGATLIVVDPRKTETARIADLHVPIRPGTDLFMLQAMIHHILEQGLEDRAFLRRHTKNHDFFEKFPFITPEQAEPICGVPAGVIREAAERFAKARSAAAIAKLGVYVSLNSTVTAWLVEVLNALTGNVDKQGGLIFNPGIFDLDLLLWIATMGKRPRSYFGKAPYLTGSFPASELPREILLESSDRVRALIVDAGNPALIFPNSKRTREALQKLDLLVSIDICMNETAQMADFILPAAHYFEAEDLYITFPEHQPYPFGQWIPQVVEPVGESKPAWEIFRDLSRQMRLPILNQWPLELLFRAGNLLGSLFGKQAKLGFSPRNYYRLMCMGLCKLPFSRLMKSPHGARAGEIPLGRFIRKRVIDVAPREFVKELERIQPPALTSEDYPLILITGERTRWAKCTTLRGIRNLTEKQSGNFLRMHPDDAARYTIREGDSVEVRTNNGFITIEAKLDENIRRDVVSIPSGWGRKLVHPDSDKEECHGVNVNELTGDTNLDPLVAMPIYNAIPCSVRRL